MPNATATTKKTRVASNGNAGSNKKTESRGQVIKFDPYERELMAIPLHSINLLEQVRDQYEEIPELANDIASSVEQHPVQVALKTPAEAQKHLNLVNEIWGSDHTLADLVRLPGRKVRYAILISGHRRTLAKLHIWHTGCDACLEKFGPEKPGACFSRHLHNGGDLVDVYIYQRISPTLAIGMQLRENIRKSVPSHRQAKAYDDLFRIMHYEDPTISVAGFARQVGGVTPDTVRRARKYCRLPEWIRQRVEQGHITYGHALELGRFQSKLGLKDSTLEAEVEKIMVGKLSVKQYKALIDSDIRKIDQGYTFLPGMGFDELVDYEHKEIRTVFDRRTISAVHSYAAYLQRVLPLLQDGRMGDPGELHRDTSFWESLRKMRQAVVAIREDFEAHELTRKRERQIEELKGTEEDISVLLEFEPDTAEQTPSMF